MRKDMGKMEEAMSETATPAAACASMNDVRREIDRVDRALVGLFAERLSYIERAAAIKQSRAQVRDDVRVADIFAKLKASCASAGFPYAIAEPVFRALVEGSIVHELAAFDAKGSRF